MTPPGHHLAPPEHSPPGRVPDPRPPVRRRSDPASRSLAVLLLEDSPTDALLIRAALEDVPVPRIEITHVPRMADGLQSLAERRFDAALLDLSLPDSAGIDTVRRLRQAVPELPVVVLTGTDDAHLVTRILAEGAQDYVLKQDLVGHLLAKAIAHAVERHRVAVELERRTRALIDSEARVREQAALIDAARDAILVINHDGQVIFWNKSAERIHGWTAGEILGQDARDFYFRDRPWVAEAWTEVHARGEWLGELWTLTRDGRVLLSDTRFSLIRDPRGRPRSILVIATDITERKKLEAEFFRAQRVDCIGSLAGGLAHDLNNVLAPITLAVGLLRDQVSTPSAQALLETVHDCNRRAIDMVRHVLAFARGGLHSQPVPIHPGELLDEVARTFRDTFLSGLEVRVVSPPDAWPFLGDRTQLHQVFLNLGVNARDAMRDGGTLTLTAANVTLGQTLETIHLPGKPGPYVVFTIADTGAGIPAEILDQVFQPFFTTKGPGRGTGLGLSTVQAIVKSHHGFVTIDSQVGRGTSIRLHLPAAPPAAAPAPPHA